MATINISETDRQSAEDFLEEFLGEYLPDADLSKGSSLRDFLITGMSLITAFFRQEVKTIKLRQSLKKVVELDDGTEKDEAVDELLSNLFIDRKTGRESRGVATIHASSARDQLIKTTDTFTRQTGRVFQLDSDVDIVYPSSDWVATRNSSGTITEYTLNILLVSIGTGAGYDIEPGTFSSWTLRSPYITKVENKSKFVGGKDVETTEELLERAPTALTLRDLLTDRSASTVIADTFTSIDKVAVVGMGDPEMQRDKITTLSDTLNIHAGGHTDLYISSAITESRTFEAAVGGQFTDPRSTITIFRDAAVADFTTAGGVVLLDVEPRMVLRVYDADTGEPTKHLIDEVNPTYLRVTTNSPLPSLRTAVEYSIGTIDPDYDEAIAQRSTGIFSNLFENVGEVLLPTEPVYLITDVSTLDAGNPLAGDDDRVHYINRVNDTPSATEADLEYAVVASNPLEVPSAYQVLRLQIPALADGTTIQVTYDTLTEFDSVHEYVTDRLNRITCASYLTKGFHVAYIEGRIQYTLRSDAQVDIDTDEATELLVNYINSFPSGELLNVSDIISFFQQTYPIAGSVLPIYLQTVPVVWEPLTAYIVGDIIKPTALSGHYYKVVTAGTTDTTEPDPWTMSLTSTVTDGTVVYVKVPNYTLGYSLYAPDGRVIPYVTSDEVLVHKDKLLNPTVIIDSLDTDDSDSSLSLGVSDRTIRYLTSNTLIEVVNV